jgi:hypothetical protein
MTLILITENLLSTREGDLKYCLNGEIKNKERMDK